MLDKEQLLAKITHLPLLIKHQVFKKKKGMGLVKKEKDLRDFETAVLGWSPFGYTPLNTRKIIEPVVVFNQGQLDVCVFCGTLSHHMDDEKIELDIADVVSWANRNGLTGANGVTDLDTCAKALQNYGCSAGVNPSILQDYATLSQKPLNTIEAAKHKISSRWSVTSRDDRLKLLDENRTIWTGIDWYTGFNQSGGFKAPWLITKFVGYKVGGHCIKIIGYDLNYQGKKVYIIQNSYGKDWADGGKFYIVMDWLDANNYGFRCTLDAGVPFGSFVTQNDGKNVRGKNACIYYIQAGQKKAYPNWSTYLAFGGKYLGFFQLTTQSDLDALATVPAGDNMDIKKSPAWSNIADIQDLDDSNHNLMSTLFNLTKYQLGIKE